MSRVQLRLLLILYRRRVLRGIVAGAAGRAVRWPAVVGQLPVSAECVTAGSLPSTGAALMSGFNCEERLPFVGVALHHYFGAVARAWVGDPLGCILRTPLAVPPLCTDVNELARVVDEAALPAAYMSLSGQ